MKLTIFLFFVLIFAASANAQKSYNKLDLFFSGLARSKQFNGNVLVTEKGRVVYEKTTGYSIS